MVLKLGLCSRHTPLYYISYLVAFCFPVYLLLLVSRQKKLHKGDISHVSTRSILAVSLRFALARLINCELKVQLNNFFYDKLKKDLGY